MLLLTSAVKQTISNLNSWRYLLGHIFVDCLHIDLNQLGGFFFFFLTDIAWVYTFTIS